jgi:hypothetical protein
MAHLEEDDTFDEDAAIEAVREQSAEPHPRDILKRENDRQKGYRRDLALEKWGPVIDEMIMRDLDLMERKAQLGSRTTQ